MNTKLTTSCQSDIIQIQVIDDPEYPKMKSIDTVSIRWLVLVVLDRTKEMLSRSQMSIASEVKKQAEDNILWDQDQDKSSK